MRVVAKVATLLLIALVSSACAMVASVRLLNDTQECSSQAGSYFLPKTHLYVTITRKAEKVGDTIKNLWHEIDVGSQRMPDRRFGYCLDYLAQASSDDIVSVTKYRDSGLLGLITTDAVDQTRVILETTIQAVFTAVSGNPSFGMTSVAQRDRSFKLSADAADIIAFQVDYDPFDPMRTAVINEGLKDYGFCIILENYTFDLETETIDSYCDDPKGSLRRSKVTKLEYKYGKGGAPLGKDAPLSPEEMRGILFRPRIPYQFYLFVKSNTQIAGGWVLRATHAVPMENIAPVAAVGLERTAFTRRKTTLRFDEGTLSAVCIYKKSELVEVANIPLVIVKSVVALPANIIQVRIDQTAGEADLYAARTELIKEQRKYLALLNNLPDANKLPSGAPPQNTTGGPKKQTPSGFLNEAQARDDSKIPLKTWWEKPEVCPPESALSAVSPSSVFFAKQPAAAAVPTPPLN